MSSVILSENPVERRVCAHLPAKIRYLILKWSARNKKKVKNSEESIIFTYFFV